MIVPVPRSASPEGRRASVGSGRDAPGSSSGCSGPSSRGAFRLATDGCSRTGWNVTAPQAAPGDPAEAGDNPHSGGGGAIPSEADDGLNLVIFRASPEELPQCRIHTSSHLRREAAMRLEASLCCWQSFRETP